MKSDSDLKTIASCSFGKDSVAAIITHIKHGGKVDVALYCKIMFDDTLSAELPEHEEWIYETAIPKLKSDWGIKTETVQADKGYKWYFYQIRKSKQNYGKIRGFPTFWGPWCTSYLKSYPIDKYLRRQDNYLEIIGLTADEPNRMKSKRKRANVILPLVEHGITQEQSFDITRDAGLLSPAYKGKMTRLGCWFCHNQRLGELKTLRKEYPDLWTELLKLDKDSVQTFKSDWTITELDARFEREEKQTKLF